jgi:hypothetical protein
MPIQRTGEASGEVTLKATGAISPEETLKFHPEIQIQLDDIEKHGWNYLCTESIATAFAETALYNSPYRISDEAQPDDQPDYVIEWVIGANIPEIKSVPEVQVFRVHLSSKSIPRAATIDLAKGTVTYLHDSFWKWETGWEKDEQKLSEGREVFEIANWLVEAKRYKLDQSLSVQRYRELSSIFKGMSGRRKMMNNILP